MGCKNLMIGVPFLINLKGSMVIGLGTLDITAGPRVFLKESWTQKTDGWGHIVHCQLIALLSLGLHNHSFLVLMSKLATTKNYVCLKFPPIDFLRQQFSPGHVTPRQIALRGFIGFLGTSVQGLLGELKLFLKWYLSPCTPNYLNQAFDSFVSSSQNFGTKEL